MKSHPPNRLSSEASPYLLQHAQNPVDWRPWGSEAFEEASRLGKPVLLSVGYSTCHWCHVMAHESFEDTEIAAVMNTLYVCIKVDREELPDVDALYMAAVQALTGQGGWPMTVWLTPQGEPFFGGTYFPARDGDRGARLGFLSILKRMREVYDRDPERVARTKNELTRLLKDGLEVSPQNANGDGALPSATCVLEALSWYQQIEDQVWGGVRGAPKFPSSFPVRLMLRVGAREGRPDLIASAERALDAMAAGGIHDHVGGGFHRYSTDERWGVPHFEKMLYDNALLILAYADAWRITRHPRHREVVESTVEYLLREMRSPEGLFYSATDADSADPEGKAEEGVFFTWTPREFTEALASDGCTEEEIQELKGYFNVEPTSDSGALLDGRAVLSRSLHGSIETIDATLVQRAKSVLYRVRGERKPPHLDDKILVSWNALTICALIHAGRIAEAERAADALWSQCVTHEGLWRGCLNGRRLRSAAYLEDHAFFLVAALDLFEAKADPIWLERALQLDAWMEGHFEDPVLGGWYRSSLLRHDHLIAREKPQHDGAEPTGSSWALTALGRLEMLTSHARYAERAARHWKFYSDALQRAPGALAETCLALDHRLAPDLLITVVLSSSDSVSAWSSACAELRDSARWVFIHAEKNTENLEKLKTLAPTFEGLSIPSVGQGYARVCKGTQCLSLARSPSELLGQVKQARSLE